MYELCELTQKNDLLLKALIEKNGKTTRNGDKGKSMVSEGKANRLVFNTSFIGKKSIYMTPLFLVTFESSNMNVHNCLVDFRESSNAMLPYSICKKLNVEPEKHSI